MSADLKPLYANLKRLNIGNYLSSKEFELISIEHNFDKEWSDLIRQYRSIKDWHNIGSKEDEEKSFYVLMTDWYDSFGNSFTNNLFATLIDFAKCSKTKLDFNPVYESLKKIGVERDRLLTFITELRRINDKEKIEEVSVIRNSTVVNQHNKVSKNKVFIVHGRDEVARLELAQVLKEEFSLEPIILQKQPNNSIDIIFPKFENLARECGLAIILFTPDGSFENTSRARQNVIFELGYFLGMWQQVSNRKIILLKRENIEIPSDISGVIYIEYHNKVTEAFYDLKKQLEHWGYKHK